MRELAACIDGIGGDRNGEDSRVRLRIPIEVDAAVYIQARDIAARDIVDRIE
ncbi:MAG: hypothetical protein ABIS07_15085 [Dokdonella sp.]